MKGSLQPPEQNVIHLSWWWCKRSVHKDVDITDSHFHCINSPWTGLLFRNKKQNKKPVAPLGQRNTWFEQHFRLCNKCKLDQCVLSCREYFGLLFILFYPVLLSKVIFSRWQRSEVTVKPREARAGLWISPLNYCDCISKVALTNRLTPVLSVQKELQLGPCLMACPLIIPAWSWVW